MGYRHYLYKIKKETFKALQNKTVDELWEKFTPQHDKDFYYEMLKKYGEEKKTYKYTRYTTRRNF